MLLELAIGDAYGAGFEYAHADFVGKYNTVTSYVKHPTHKIAPGAYTDDTQMSIAVAEAMLSEQPWTPELLVQKFVEAFQRDPREGYAQGFYTFLRRVRDGQQFLAEIRPDSDKSGAAMRAAPIGIYPSISTVIQRTTLQAALTHNTPDGINAAVAAALMTHYFIYRVGPKQELGHFLEQHVAGKWSQLWTGEVKSKAWMSVRAAITAISKADSMRDLLKTCVQFCGDVDTVATIALAAASWSSEIVQDLPSSLVTALENGPYGRAYLLQLDAQLKQLQIHLASTQ